MEDIKKRKFGGRTRGTWDSKWRLGKTRLIRVPLAISEEILEIARSLDSGNIERATDVLNKLSIFTHNKDCTD